MFCGFIERWPTLIQVKRARITTLTTFFRAGNTRNPTLLETRLASIRSSQHLTLDKAVIAPNKLHVLMLVGMLSVMLDAIKSYDQTIAELAPKHDDYYLFSSLPGAGPSLAPRLLVAFGEQRSRFKNAAEMQKYSGIAPVTERSGN